MRPLGGVLFGYVADRLGRTQALKSSIAVMAVPTILIGFLPTYDQWGAAAAGILIPLRLIQGISVGGELIASITFLVESAPKNRKGLYGSWAIFGGIGGILLGSGMVTLTEAVVAEGDMSTFGWRIPFLFGFVIFIFGRWLRSALTADTPPPAGGTEVPVKKVLPQHLGSVFHLLSPFGWVKTPSFSWQLVALKNDVGSRLRDLSRQICSDMGGGYPVRGGGKGLHPCTCVDSTTGVGQQADSEAEGKELLQAPPRIWLVAEGILGATDVGEGVFRVQHRECQRRGNRGLYQEPYR